VTERGQHKLGADSGRAGDPDDPEIGRVLKTAHPCQIGSPIAAPVAEKSGDFCFPVAHGYLLTDSYQLLVIGYQVAEPITRISIQYSEPNLKHRTSNIQHRMKGIINIRCLSSIIQHPVSGQS